MNWFFGLVGLVLLVVMGRLLRRWWWQGQKRIVSGRDVSESAFLFTLANFSHEEGGLNLGSAALRALQTGVECAFVGMASARLLITSTRPGEGKSYVATMLAIGLAQAGQRVLLLEANLSRPELAYRFNLPSPVGLTDLLLAVEEKKQPDLMAFAQSSAIPNLTLLPAGTSPCTDLTPLRQVVTTAATYFNYVIIDGPAILSVGPSFPFYAQYAILVAATGQVRQWEFKQAIESLQKSGANILGVVLNQPQPQTNPTRLTEKKEWFRPVLNQLNHLAQTLFTLDTIALTPALAGVTIPQPQTSHTFSASPEPSPQAVPDLSDDLQLANTWHNLTLAHLTQQANHFQEQLAEGLFILRQQETALQQQQALGEAWRQKARLGDEAFNRLLSHKNQLTIQVEQAIAENDRLIQTNNSLNNQNQRLALTLEQLTSEKNSLSRTLEQLQTDSTQLQQQVSQTLTIQAKLQQQLEQSQQELASEKQEKRDLSQILERTYGELARIRQQWEQSLTVQTNLNQLLAQFREELRLKEQQLELATVERQKLTQSLLATEAKLSGRDAELATIQQKLRHISQLYQRYRE